MAGLFGGQQQAAPVQVETPKREDPKIEEARRRALIAARLRRGRASTQLTGGLGVSAPANVARKQLLGT